MFKKTVKIILSVGILFSVLLIQTAKKVPDSIYFSYGQDIRIKSLPIVTLDISSSSQVRQAVQSTDSTLYTAHLFGVLPIKTVSVVQSDEKYVNVSGKPFGVKMFCDGVMVVGFSDILTSDGYKNPAKNAGLKTGDIITEINDKTAQSNSDVEKAINKSKDTPIKITYLRDNQKNITVIKPVQDLNTNTWRTGMWVRDSAAGIGTMTFYDTENGYFAGLGHGIKDVDTNKELRLLSGEIVPVKITGITKSKIGSAGQLKGTFMSTLPAGKVLHNGNTGVYGKAYTTDNDNMMAVAAPGEIQTGKAYILTTISGTQPQMYEIEIEKISLTASDQNKNMVIRITDSRLLTLTGGIVRGMSGSPIIQNGKLVGAVTHVCVNL